MEWKLMGLVGLVLATTATAVCTEETFSNSRTFARCVDLDPLDATLHWTLAPSRDSVAFAFRVETDGWAAWGLNPTGSGMVGTQALVAFRNGTGGVVSYPADLVAKRLRLVQSSISIGYSNLSAEYVNEKMTIYVVLNLPGNRTFFNHTWNTGPVRDGVPAVHPFEGDHDKSYGEVNLASPGGGGAPVSAPGGAPGSAPGGAPGSIPSGAPDSTPGVAPGRSGASGGSGGAARMVGSVMGVVIMMIMMVG